MPYMKMGMVTPGMGSMFKTPYSMVRDRSQSLCKLAKQRDDRLNEKKSSYDGIKSDEDQ